MIGGLISAAASLGSTLLGNNAANKANKTQRAIADQNIKLQKQFAQQGIRWKVEDAKRAGISPLYALGANTVSFSPVSVGTTVPDFSGIASAGQDIGRAIDATRTASERAGAVTKTMEALQVQRMGLENELLASQIAKVRQTQTPPMPGDPYLIEGQSGSGVVDVKPSEQVSTVPGRPALQAGATSDLAYARTGDGGYAAIPSQDVKRLIEDDISAEIAWAVRNRIAPFFGSNFQPPPYAPREYGHSWYYDPFRGGYYQRPSAYRKRADRFKFMRGNW